MKSYMIMDMQYGSTGKGLLAGYLAVNEEPDVVVTAWGPNAGHTYIDRDGRVFIHRMLANGIVSPRLAVVLIGPGSVIDLSVLYNELSQCADLLQGKNVIIHPHAAIVLPEHLEQEKKNVTIGSTMKGTGAAVVQRIGRDPKNMNVASAVVSEEWLESVRELGINIYVDDERYRITLDQAELVQIEGAQGYSLSIYHGAYPYCTSRDVTPAQVMADCAIPFSMVPEVYGTLRTFPIRVSNRQVSEGVQYSSGPCYVDQVELDWQNDLGMEPELTTVTKLPRRIFSFSDIQLRRAVHHCAPTKIFLNFANYLKSTEELIALVDKIEEISQSDVAWIGIGPNHGDVVPSIQMTNGMTEMMYGEQA